MIVYSIAHVPIFLMVICMTFCDQSLHRMIRMLSISAESVVFRLSYCKNVFLFTSCEERCVTSSMDLIASRDIFETSTIARICNFKQVLYKKN